MSKRVAFRHGGYVPELKNSRASLWSETSDCSENVAQVNPSTLRCSASVGRPVPKTDRLLESQWLPIFNYGPDDVRSRSWAETRHAGVPLS